MGEISIKINHTLSSAYNDAERKRKHIKQMNIMLERLVNMVLSLRCP